MESRADRAVRGQQVSVRGATTIAGRLVERHGTPLAAPDGALAPLAFVRGPPPGGRTR